LPQDLFGLHRLERWTVRFRKVKIKKLRTPSCVSGTSAASFGLCAYSSVDMLGERYKSVNFPAQTGVFPPEDRPRRPG
jgi:hypothetical protein